MISLYLGPTFDPVAFAHPDDVLQVFEHDAVWVDGNAMRVVSSSGERRGMFRIVRPLAHGSLLVTNEFWPVPDVPGDRSAALDPRVDAMNDAVDEGPGSVLHDGLTAQACLERYELAQREAAPLDLTAPQLGAARALWSARLRAAVESGG